MDTSARRARLTIIFYYNWQSHNNNIIAQNMNIAGGVWCAPTAK